MRTLTGLIVGLSCFGIAALSPASAADECAQWRVPQDWDLVQDNGFNLNLKTSQDKNQHLRGVATSWNETMVGNVDGHVSGDKLVFAVYWDNNSVGDYNGTIDNAGHVEGFTQDRNNKSAATAGFHGRDLLNCAKWVQSSPPPEAPAQSSGPQPSPDATMHKSHEEAGTSPPSGPSSQDGVGKPLPTPPASEAEKLGVIKKPGKKIGDILKETTPPTPEEKLGVFEKP